MQDDLSSEHAYTQKDEPIDMRNEMCVEINGIIRLQGDGGFWGLEQQLTAVDGTAFDRHSPLNTLFAFMTWADVKRSRMKIRMTLYLESWGPVAFFEQDSRGRYAHYSNETIHAVAEWTHPDRVKKGDGDPTAIAYAMVQWIWSLLDSTRIRAWPKRKGATL